MRRTSMVDAAPCDEPTLELLAQRLNYREKPAWMLRRLFEE